MGRLATAQAAVVTVRGVAYDSVRNAPLAGALVVVGGGVDETVYRVALHPEAPIPERATR